MFSNLKKKKESKEITQIKQYEKEIILFYEEFIKNKENEKYLNDNSSAQSPSSTK